MEKKLTTITILFLLCFDPTMGWGERLSLHDLVQKRGIWYEEGKDVPFSGNVDGGKIKKGKEHGPWKISMPTSMHYQSWMEGRFKDGQKHLVWSWYTCEKLDKNCQQPILRQVERFKKGKIIGVSELYSKSGLLETKHYYEDSKIVLTEEYYASGKLYSKREYITGKYHGLHAWYYRDGSLIKTVLYHNGEVTKTTNEYLRR